ncbi:S9 family peptidase [Williamsia sp. CHRR-6]|uniref:S9 family peptidase n=1 Tax=Williamsia sp. CHRR-6 TaxID=2835871 RepID=UPI001BD9B2D8|nr:S9 family peptidase [Williamsia sp. CHRR-6]MBT0568310.1 S9 family peptidase [Williamsia sp. CHRR-6]
MPHNVFTDLAEFVALSRITSLTGSPDGSRLVAEVSALNEKKTGYVTSLWQIDPTGSTSAVQLTQGTDSATGPVFDGDGALWFLRTSTTPAAGADSDHSDAKATALWQLPAVGEGRCVLTRPGGFGSLAAASSAPRVLALGDVLGGSPDRDAAIRADRSKTSVTAILHDSYPVRYWDHDIGPDRTHLFSVYPQAETDPTATSLLADPGVALRESQVAVSPDGSFAVVTWTVGAPLAAQRSTLVRVDLGTGARTVLVDTDDAEYGAPIVSPDATRVAFIRESISSPDHAPRMTLGVCDAAGGDRTEWAGDWDRWPSSVAWSADGTSLIVTADDNGRAHIFDVAESGAVRAITSGDHAYSSVVVHPDGATLFAVRSAIAQPPHIVSIDIATGAVTVLDNPVSLPEVPGAVEDVVAQAADGTTVRGWLVLPDHASSDAPVPLLLWIHGGPLGSWNAWSWRWTPWLMVAKGYAVLLPDPALSTGYGQDFIERGWGRWGAEPFTDLMAITDAVVADPRIDAERTAAMGGSFGGYMANWVAGHTDRFKAIVTHASLWALDSFGPTTDASYYWAREMTPEMAVANSPHLFVADIRTPMLVIHGDKDYRVPIGEGLRLWYELLAESGLPAADDGTTEHRFLYFPDENHWILKPQHATVWYQVVESFLAHHVLGESVPLPAILGGSGDIAPPGDPD